MKAHLRPDMNRSPATLTELAEAIARHPNDRPAFAVPGATITYAELSERTRTMARALFGHGVRAGDHVGVFLPNTVEFVEAVLSLHRLGAIPVPLNARFRTTELNHVARDAGLVAILTGAAGAVDHSARLSEAFPHVDGQPGPRAPVLASTSLRFIALLDGTSRPGFLPRADLLAAADRVSDEQVWDQGAHARADDTGILLYSSGTTSTPKGCRLTHAALLHTASARFARLRPPYPGEPDRLWAPCPLFHVGTLVPLLGALLRGDTFITSPHFDAGTAVQLMTDHRPTTLWPMFPAITIALIDHPAFAGLDTSAVRQVCTSGTPEVLDRVQVAFETSPVFSIYGMSETCGAITVPNLDDSLAVRRRSCGPPIDGVEIMICDPTTNEPLPSGRQGEIRVRGRSVFAGYHGAPELTAAAFANGWFRTGDLGSVDEAGNVSFEGRLKDMLKVGGENVSPLEIEARLETHPAVRHAEVVGRQDPRLDEVPVAFVELEPLTSATEAELIAHCEGHIAGFKVPRQIHFIAADGWPTSATKVSKVALRRTAAEIGTAGRAAPDGCGRSASP